MDLKRELIACWIGFGSEEADFLSVLFDEVEEEDEDDDVVEAYPERRAAKSNAGTSSQF